jgi:hypothetical protein
VNIPERPLKVVAIGEKTGLEIDNSELIFAQLEVANTNAYTQEYFDFDVVLYWRQLNLRGDIKIIDIETAGLQFGTFQGTRTTEQFINGNRYYVSRFKNKAKALAHGDYTIHPTVRVDVLVSGRMQLMREVKTLDIAVEPISIHIVPPPADGRPESFKGAVGKFQFSAEVSPLEIEEGTPITIRMMVSGTGSIDTALAPVIANEKDFKIYDSRLTDDRINQSKTAGRRLFEQVVEPRNPDITAVPALEFSYFDPETERYETIRRGTCPIVINPATNQVPREVGGQAVVDPDRKQVFGEYIEYLKPLPKRWKDQNSHASTLSPVILGLQIIPPLLALVGFVAGRRKESLASDVQKARKHEAPKIARVAIRKAQQAQKENDAPAFYEAASEALDGYLANKLNIGAGEVSIDVVRQRFDSEKHGDLIDQIDVLFATHEARRFSPSGAKASDSQELQEHLSQITATLKACEKVKV